MPPRLEDIRNAHTCIEPFVHRTPVFTSETLDNLAGARLFFKAENFQKTGAFKYRGATYAVQTLLEEEAHRGVATHSSGNHGQALALAARMRGIPAHIVMPSNAPRSKHAAVTNYGGRITLCKPTLEARESTLAEVVKSTGAAAVHPYDDDRIICGQGTAALELLADTPDLDAILAPVGGGGLLAGTAIAAHGLRPELTVYGSEPELADDAFRSLRQGKRLPPCPPRTVADGLRTALGERNFPIISRHVAEIFLVGEAEILLAMRQIWERAKLVIEPSAAVPVAAALARPGCLRGKRVGIILSGGNVDLCRNSECNFWKPSTDA